MVLITTSCPRHGTVRCRPEEVNLHLVLDELRYSFPCDGCGGRVSKLAHWEDVPLLAAAGIDFATEDDRNRADAPLTLADLDAFCRLLRANECLVALLSN